MYPMTFSVTDYEELARNGSHAQWAEVPQITFQERSEPPLQVEVVLTTCHGHAASAFSNDAAELCWQFHTF